MNDSFYELIVARQKRATDTLFRIFLIILTIAITYIALLFAGPFAFFLLVGLVFALYYFVFPLFKAEFEYTLVNHDLEVSVIYNKQKRKHKAEFNIQEAEIIAPTGSPRLNNFHPVKAMDFSSGDSAAATYSIIIPLNSKLTQVIIEPDEKMIQQMKGWMGQKMFLD